MTELSAGDALRRWLRPHLQFASRVSKEGVPHSLFASTIEILASAASGLLVVRILNPASLADLRVAQAYIGWVGVVAGMGMATPILRYCAGRIGEAGPESHGIEPNPVLLSAIRAGVVASVFVAVAAACLARTGLLMRGGHSAGLFLLLLLSIPFTVVSGYCVTYLQAVRELKRLAGWRIVLRVSSVIVTLGAAAFAGVGGYTASLIGVSVVWAFIMRSLVGRTGTRGRRAGFPAGFLSMAMLSMLANLVGTVRSTADLALLDRMCPDRSGIAAYSVAQSLVAMASSVLVGLQVVSVPFFAEIKPGTGQLRARLLRNQKRLFALALMGAVGAWLLGTAFGALFLGPAYRQLPLLAVPLLLAFVCQSTFSLVSAALIGIGRVDVNLKVAVVAMGAGIALCWIGIRLWGLPGAAIGQAAGVALYAVLQWAVGWPVLARSDGGHGVA